MATEYPSASKGVARLKIGSLPVYRKKIGFAIKTRFVEEETVCQKEATATGESKALELDTDSGDFKDFRLQRIDS